MSITHKAFKESLISHNLDNRTLCTVNECARVHPAIGEVIKLTHCGFPVKKGWGSGQAPQT